MTDMITTLRNMAASEWANVYEHREFLLSVASLLTEYEADEPRKELVYVRREYDDIKARLKGSRHQVALLEDRLSALELAAWNVCDVVQDAIDDPEDADMKAIQSALDAMGELIPAACHADSATSKSQQKRMSVQHGGTSEDSADVDDFGYCRACGHPRHHCSCSTSTATLHQCSCGHKWMAPALPDKNCPKCNPVTVPAVAIAYVCADCGAKYDSHGGAWHETGCPALAETAPAVQDSTAFTNHEQAGKLNSETVPVSEVTK